MGESLQIIADALREQGVIYDDGRSWNKNTIARILEDERYAGKKGYPKLIDQEQLQAVAEKRFQKAASPQRTELQKVLRRLCRKNTNASVEQQVESLLNGLLLDTLNSSSSPCEASTKTHPLRRWKWMILDQQPIDEERAQSVILKIAAEQYEALGDDEYETIRLRRLFTSAEKLSAELLEMCSSGN